MCRKYVSRHPFNGPNSRPGFGGFGHGLGGFGHGLGGFWPGFDFGRLWLWIRRL